MQPALFSEEGQQAGHEDAPVSAAIAEEADDEVDAGLTLSHGPGEEGAQCLAKVLNDCGKTLLAHICCRIDIVGAKVAVQGVVEVRVSETSASRPTRRGRPGRWRALSHIALNGGAHIALAVVTPWERPRLGHACHHLRVLHASRGYIDGDAIICRCGHGACVGHRSTVKEQGV